MAAAPVKDAAEDAVMMRNRLPASAGEKTAP